MGETSISHIYDQIRDIPILPHEHVVLLSRRYRDTGCERSRQKLIHHNLRLVAKIASTYTNAVRGSVTLDMDDVFQSGFIGLDRASRKFDPDRGYRFSTYAKIWIANQIQRQIYANGLPLKIPHYIKRDALQGGDIPELVALSTAVETTIGTDHWDEVNDRLHATDLWAKISNSLTDDERQLLVNLYWEGESRADLATDGGVSRQAIYDRHSKLMGRLVLLLDEHGVTLAST